MDESLLKKLLEAFAMEAREHLDLMRSSLRAVKETGADEMPAWLEQTFRSMHSLKGAARAVNQHHIESLCMMAESFFSRLREQMRLPDENETELLHECMDAIEGLMEDPSFMDSNEVQTLSERLKKSGTQSPPVTPPKAPSPAPPPAAEQKKKEVATEDLKPKPKGLRQSVRVSEERLNALGQDVEELIQLKLSTKFQEERLDSLSEKILRAKQTWSSLSPLLNRLEELTAGLSDSKAPSIRKHVHRLWEHVEDLQLHMEPVETLIQETNYEGGIQARSTARVVDSVEGQLHELLMLPLSESFLILHKVVRDLSLEQSKEVDLHVIGDQIEVDRRILETLKDPMLHLIRNSVDHGIEKPEERLEKGKPKRGRIEIRVEQIGSGRIEMTYSDDGRGLNLQVLREKMTASGLVTAEEVKEMEDTRIFDSIFISGISTTHRVNEISGRGLGMSIVRENIALIGGTVSVVESSPLGTTLKMEFPVVQATQRGILFALGKALYVIATPSVESMQRISKKSLQTVKNQTSFLYREKAMPLNSLTRILGIKESSEGSNADNLLVLVLKSGNRRLAVQVDEVIREQEVLVKSLGPQLRSVAYLSGVAITGLGEPALLLNAGEVITASAEKGATPLQQLSAPEITKIRKKRVLIVDDSFTSRLLIKNVLETAGYETEVAVDGAAGFATLKTQSFDVVVSDVDMPRMNGFVLTERIRNDRKLGELPVVLVTSLATREDRERGIDAGANAYLIKSNFDQAELLEVLGRLIGKGKKS